jgi:hypothetical protein
MHSFTYWSLMTILWSWCQWQLWHALCHYIVYIRYKIIIWDVTPCSLVKVVWHYGWMNCCVPGWDCRLSRWAVPWELSRGVIELLWLNQLTAAVRSVWTFSILMKVMYWHEQPEWYRDCAALARAAADFLTRDKDCSTHGYRLSSRLEERWGVAAAGYLYSPRGCQPSLYSQNAQYICLHQLPQWQFLLLVLFRCRWTLVG